MTATATSSAELTDEQLELVAAKAEELKLSPEVAAYLLTRGIAWPTCVPDVKTPEPREVPGALFDGERVDRVLRVCMALRHIKGRHAGRPLELDAWQVAYVIAPVFGWVAPNVDGKLVRIVRKLWCEVPRKNGKSTLCSALGLYLLAADGEQGAEVYAAAAAKPQARLVFDPSRIMAERSPSLSKHVLPLRDRIVHTSTASYFAVLSADADLQHGLNVHGGVVDEVHVHKSRDLIDVLETGTGSREQPLLALITTADDGAPGTIYDEHRRLVEQLARGVLVDSSVFGVVWQAPEGADPFAESTQRAANPGYGVSVQADYLRTQAESARNSPAKLNTYLRLHLNRRTKQDRRWMTLKLWDDSAGPLEPRQLEASLAGLPCFGGLDLASTSDLAALCWDFPHEDGTHDALWRFWAPEAKLSDLDERTAGNASRWVADGFLILTPGAVTDYKSVRAQIGADRQAFDVQALAFDRWNASQLVVDLEDEDGFDPTGKSRGPALVGMGQGFVSMGSPMAELLRLVTTKSYRHAGNPVQRWMVDNLAVKSDPTGAVKPDKSKSADKIDGVPAAAMALDQATRAKPKRPKRAAGF